MIPDKENDEQRVASINNHIVICARERRKVLKQKAAAMKGFNDTLKSLDTREDKLLEEIDYLTDPDKFPLFKSALDEDKEKSKGRKS
jgi:hypothetical protein